MKFVFSYLLILGLLMFNCEGKQGPQGPPGPGSRIVYNGTASTDEYVVNIPELHLNDFPSINCYYFLEGSWSELYVSYESNSDVVFPFALIEEQRVILFLLESLQYKIVIVI